MRAAVAVFLCLAGCSFESTKYKAYPPNPFKDIRVVAVLPFVNGSGQPVVDTVEFANICASELVKFDGFRAVRPRFLATALQPGEHLQSVDDALRLARRVKADAVLAAVVTDYDPYEPPRVALSVQFLGAAARSMSDAEIDRIIRSASWRRGPLEVTRDKAGHCLAAFEAVYDAHEERIRRELVWYAEAQDDSDTPFEREREFLAVQSRYMQFVSNQLIHRLLGMVAPDAP
jgi:hypothetical protein